jgi:hypothetical protein
MLDPELSIEFLHHLGGELGSAVQDDLIRSPMQGENVLDVHVCDAFSRDGGVSGNEVSLLSEVVRRLSTS